MLHIPRLVRNLISISRMSDVGVHIIFEKDSCMMVCRVMVLIRGAQIGTLYKLLGRNDSIIVLKVDETSSCLVYKTTLWH